MLSKAPIHFCHLFVGQWRHLVRCNTVPQVLGELDTLLRCQFHELFQQSLIHFSTLCNPFVSAQIISVWPPRNNTTSRQLTPPSPARRARPAARRPIA